MGDHTTLDNTSDVVSAADVPAPAHCQMTAEELVAKAIAPVKRDFLRPPPVRACDSKAESNTGDEKGTAANDAVSAPILKEKKSKRQQKRDRRQEQKSALHICPEVSKSGKVSSCPYNENCRYSHDLEAFKAQKPDDLDGICPFLSIEGPCPYGLACRFAGTHKDDINGEFDNGAHGEDKRKNEINVLKKDVQKLLWKNNMKFPKSEAALKLLGLLGKNKKMNDGENDGQIADGNCCEVPADTSSKLDGVEEVLEEVKPDEADELRPPKKSKCSTDETCPAPLSDVQALDKKDDMDHSCEQNKPETIIENIVEDNDKCLKLHLREPKESKCSTDETCPAPLSDVQALDKKDDMDHSCEQNKPETIIENIVEDNDKCLKLHLRERKLIDFREKLYLAPLTTVGNLPYRRVCKVLGADVTCGEMAMCTNLLQGQASEWALLRRHSSEDFFGVQICGAFPDTVTKTVELIEQHCTVDFIDINMGCPIDIVVNKGAGSALLTKPMRMKSVIEASSRAVDTPVTIKVRMGYFEGKNRIDSLIQDIGNWGASAVTIHGRTRQQRYSKLADWDYINQCVRAAPYSLQVLGNGDVFSYLDWNKHKSDCPELSSCMIARGALVKPWIFTEIKEQRHWDISSGERLDILKDYVRFGLQHWGSDSKGIETTRHFLLEWLSYTCRYIPVGLLDVIPQRINWRPPSYFGRDELETLMASDSAADWVRISEMLLGKVPSGFTFAPKHKSSAYDKAENG